MKLAGIDIARAKARRLHRGPAIVVTAVTLAGIGAAAGLTTSAGGSANVEKKGGAKIGVHVVRSRGRFVPIPGFPRARIDNRLLRDITYLRRKYHIAITAGYAMSGHAARGEHPLGLALDIVPGEGGSWGDIDRLARFAEPRQNRPRAPWRWVGYNGDAGHGRGNHLHLSWNHAAARPGHPAAWVQVLTRKRG